MKKESSAKDTKENIKKKSVLGLFFCFLTANKRVGLLACAVFRWVFLIEKTHQKHRRRIKILY